jgi:hypothetical protein
MGFNSAFKGLNFFGAKTYGLKVYLQNKIATLRPT